jgi:6-phosphofructo-2-kinase / fructose-2,6-biphosphatase 4
VPFPPSIKRCVRPELVRLNPGDCDGLTQDQILARWPEETGRRKRDPYHHRYPRAESYHDLANRLWPVMLEMEREVSDLCIIAHESVLRVLCAYFMENSADVPTPLPPVLSPEQHPFCQRGSC